MGGDFSAAPIALIDPATGAAFPGNQIPLSQIDNGSLALLSYIPRANLPGTSQNYLLTGLAQLRRNEGQAECCVDVLLAPLGYDAARLVQAA